MEEEKVYKASLWSAVNTPRGLKQITHPPNTNLWGKAVYSNSVILRPLRAVYYSKNNYKPLTSEDINDDFTVKFEPLQKFREKSVVRIFCRDLVNNIVIVLNGNIRWNGPPENRTGRISPWAKFLLDNVGDDRQLHFDIKYSNNKRYFSVRGIPTPDLEEEIEKYLKEQSNYDIVLEGEGTMQRFKLAPDEKALLSAVRSTMEKLGRDTITKKKLLASLVHGIGGKTMSPNRAKYVVDHAEYFDFKIKEDDGEE